MKDLYILGAGGHAKETYLLVKRVGKWKIKAMLDIESRNPVIVDGDTVPILAESILEKVDSSKTCLVIGIAGSINLLKKMVDKYSTSFEFPNVIDPTVVISNKSVQIGIGNVIQANCTITTNLSIGSFNIFNIGCIVHHDSKIGNYNIFGPSVNISGGVQIADQNYLGVKSTILQYLSIGSCNVIGASSLVTKDLNNGITVVGIPAKQIKQ